MRLNICNFQFDVLLIQNYTQYQQFIDNNLMENNLKDYKKNILIK